MRSITRRTGKEGAGGRKVVRAGERLLTRLRAVMRLRR